MGEEMRWWLFKMFRCWFRGNHRWRVSFMVKDYQFTDRRFEGGCTCCGALKTMSASDWRAVLDYPWPPKHPDAYDGGEEE